MKKELKMLLESEIEKAEIVLGVKAITDDLQSMAEKVSKMQVEDISALTERLKAEYGVNVGTEFQAKVNEILSQSLKALQYAKSNIDNEALVLSGDQDKSEMLPTSANQQTDMIDSDNEVNDQPTEEQPEEQTDDFGGEEHERVKKESMMLSKATMIVESTTRKMSILEKKKLDKTTKYKQLKKLKEDALKIKNKIVTKKKLKESSAPSINATKNGIRVQTTASGDLKFTIADTSGKEFLSEIVDSDKNWALKWADFTEDFVGNGVFDTVAPEEVGALTDAPILTDEKRVEDNGDVSFVGKLWWYPSYETTDPLEQLLTDKVVIFSKGSENVDVYESRSCKKSVKNKKSRNKNITEAENKDGKYGYVAFYKGKQIDVWANSSYEAQKKAAEKFKAKKSYDVTVVLAQKGDEEVVHNPALLDSVMTEAVSRKDFIFDAKLISDVEDSATRKKLAYAKADYYAKQNERFNRAKFLAACNVVEEELTEKKQIVKKKVKR